jgi:putative aminopeptidase FrvX
MVKGELKQFLDRLRLTETHISAQLDNVLSVALLIHAYRKGYQGTALFSTGEEAGRSWRHLLAWFQRKELTTERLLVFDTSPYDTSEDAEKQDIVLRWRDANGLFNRQLVGEVLNACKHLKIKRSFKDELLMARNEAREAEGQKPLSLGRTELGNLINNTEGQINGATVQFPTTGYHTASETCALSSVRAMLRLLKYLLKLQGQPAIVS